MKLAFSSCPNDTFVFHAWVHGLVDGAPVPEVTYADVDVTNTRALSGEFDVVKVSYAALPWLRDQYELLPCGGALGRGCGPLVLAREAREPESLRHSTVAVPGERTTAYLLFRLWSQGFTPENIVVVPFAQIMPGIASGRFDAGLVIHEARFTYHEHGLTMMEDLGDWWERETGCPIPLGAILARKGLDTDAIAGWIRASLAHAWAHPADSASYVAEHSQELSPEVTRQHIELYVNEFTAELGDAGRDAVDTLLGHAAAAGLVPGNA
ncbi:MAG: 1,4-dihydroxy-6-naphthoate synthase [Stackebrandtia sp.]